MAHVWYVYRNGVWEKYLTSWHCLANNNDKPGAKVILNALLLSVNFVIVISRSP